MLRTHMWAAGVSLAVAAATFVLVRVDRSDPINITALYTTQSQVRQGDKLDVMYNYIVQRRCENSMIISMFDKTEMIRRYETPLDETVGTPRDLGPDVYTGMLKKIGIPVQSDIGLARIDVVIESKCRFWHKWWPLYTKARSLNFLIQPVVLVEPTAVIPPSDVKELKEDLKELKEKLGVGVEPGPESEASIPSSAPASAVVAEPVLAPPPSPPAADDYKPPVIEKVKPKKKKTKVRKPEPEHDDDDGNDRLDPKPAVNAESRTNQQSAHGSPNANTNTKTKPSAQSEDTPAWFNKLLKDLN